MGDETEKMDSIQDSGIVSDEATAGSQVVPEGDCAKQVRNILKQNACSVIKKRVF